jgi:hypothetical protein
MSPLAFFLASLEKLDIFCVPGVVLGRARWRGTGWEKVRDGWREGGGRGKKQLTPGRN